MPTQHIETLTVITSQSLAVLSRQHLIDLLQHKTQLLVTARTAGIKFPNYINGLTQEVKLIQAELMKRD